MPPESSEISRSMASEVLKLNRAHGATAVAFASVRYAVTFGAGSAESAVAVTASTASTATAIIDAQPQVYADVPRRVPNAQMRRSTRGKVADSEFLYHYQS